MVSGISSTSGIQYQQTFTEKKLMAEEKKQLEEILAKYDPESMAEDETKALFDELKSSGIRPSKEVREILDSAGFKPPEKPQGPPPVEMGTNSEMSIPDFLAEFLEKQEAGTVTDQDLNLLIQQLQNNGAISQGVLVDKKV